MSGVFGKHEIEARPVLGYDRCERERRLNGAIVIGGDIHRARPDQSRFIIQKIAKLSLGQPVVFECMSTPIPGVLADFASQGVPAGRQELVAQSQDMNLQALYVDRLDGQAGTR
jgi:hypothetical protein